MPSEGFNVHLLDAYSDARQALKAPESFKLVFRAPPSGPYRLPAFAEDATLTDELHEELKELVRLALEVQRPFRPPCLAPDWVEFAEKEQLGFNFLAWTRLVERNDEHLWLEGEPAS
jgi:hypothetical protein